MDDSKDQHITYKEIVLRLTSDGILLEETSGSLRGCNDLLKQSEKYAFNMFDLSLSVIASLPSSERVGIVELSALIISLFSQNCS